MDIIPTNSSNRTPLEVPYLIDKSQPYVFDNGPSAGFPERMGWDPTKELYAVVAIVGPWARAHGPGRAGFFLRPAL
jgi:hypothetical protein